MPIAGTTKYLDLDIDNDRGRERDHRRLETAASSTPTTITTAERLDLFQATPWSVHRQKSIEALQGAAF